MKIVKKTGKAFIPTIIISIMCLYIEPTRGAISMVVLTPASPTILSTGLGYYLAGVTYNFDVRVVDPTATAWGDITLVRLIIPNTQNVDIQTSAPLTGIGAQPAPTDNIAAANTDETATVLAGGTFNDCTVRFAVTFRWDTPESVWAAARAITAEADSTGTPGTVTDVVNTSYGVCSTIRMFNQAQDGEAADGWINPNYAGFNVTSILVYNVPGASAADNIAVLDAGEITNTELLLDAAGTGLTDNATPYTYAVSLPLVIAGQALQHNWTIRATMFTAGALEDTVDSLQLRSDEVEVQDIQFIGGGGITTIAVPPKRYYRSVPVPGTQFRVTARMRYALTPMVGGTTIAIETAAGVASGTVVIPNGLNTWDATLTYPLPATAPVGSTTEITYRASNVSGGATGTQVGFANILQYAPANYSGIFWDNIDPPGVAVNPFTPMGLPTQTATSFTLNWTALGTACPGMCNGDWDSTPVTGSGTYRVYYKKSTDPTYITVDRSTSAAMDLILGNRAWTTVDITGLEPLTNYDWKFSAVDIFGNEVAGGYQAFGTITTLASQTTMTLSDGISKYEDASFNGQNVVDPKTTHKVRKVNLRVLATIVTAGNNPDSVYIVLSNNDLDLGPGAPQWGLTGTFNDIVLAPDKIEYNCLKIGANKWEGYIPGDSPLMAVGNTLRYILKIGFKGIYSYVDHDADYDPVELVPPGDHTDFEWRFYVEKQVNAQPWPTKIFNNVLTKGSPVCYPAYYLTEDANVTIRIYDVLGKPIATIMDGAFRKGGENIKDQGWAGVNKAGRKVGPGLYYIHIKAEGVSGKTIINKFNKVAVAW